LGTQAIIKITLPITQGLPKFPIRQFDSRKIWRDSRKKIDKFDKIMAEIELFCEGTTIFCVTNRLENSTTAWVTSEEPPKFTVDGYPRDV
jgi:hypothetical protein